jgi:GntR family transcriptional repressor for pyruvate dehydrogenase complex
VLEKIEADLASGALAIGGRLPGERGLAEELGVSRSTVREAILVLEAMGVVRTAVGSGADAGAVIIADPSAALSAALRLHLASSHLLVDDLLATRLLLETWSVRAAAKTAGRAGLDAAQAALAAMDDPALAPEEFHRLDAEFHVSLSIAAGNPLVAATMSALRDSIHAYVMAAIPRLPDWQAMARRLRREHHAIFSAVRDGDGDRAATLVERHIEGFYRATGLGAAKR